MTTEQAAKKRRARGLRRLICVALLTSALIIAAVYGLRRPVPATAEPVADPTAAPTAMPTAAPSTVPSAVPTAAPTIAPEDTFVPAPAPESDDELVLIEDYIGNVTIDLRYATSDNFTGKPVYFGVEAQLCYGTVKKLATAAEMLREHGYTLIIWDAYRPLAAQELLWEAFPDPTFVADPRTGFSAHSRGNTVDVALATADGALAALPSEFDEFSALADRDYSDVSDAAAVNARLLESVMTECGFKGYSNEWWHYSDTETYPALAAAEESLWRVNCRQYLTVRCEPVRGARGLGRVYAGDTVEVVGWDNIFAKIQYEDIAGYVMSSYLTNLEDKPADELEIVEPSDSYTYDRLTLDAAALAAKYPLLTVASLGTSVEGRDIPLLIVGDEDAARHVLVQGAIHAREHMTAALIMCQTELMLQAGGYENVCFHIIPMMNPDGVTVSQTQELNEAQTDIYKYDKRRNYTDYSRREYALRWKANAAGVDLNRNFAADWEGYNGHKQPSSSAYKGLGPEDQPESRALADYTRSRAFAATVSYHSSGSVIYCTYGDREPVNSLSVALAERISDVTGYPPETDYSLVDAGGYKDWAIAALGIPSVTIEIGTVESPLPMSEFASVYHRNRNVLPAIAQWVTEQDLQHVSPQE